MMEGNLHGQNEAGKHATVENVKKDYTGRSEENHKQQRLYVEPNFGLVIFHLETLSSKTQNIPILSLCRKHICKIIIFSEIPF